MASPRAIPVAGKSSILGWWKQNAHEYARLSHMFRDVYGVPASSAGVEREFSKCGCVAAPGRARSNPATIRETIIYKSFLVRNEEDEIDSIDLEDEVDDEDEDGQVAQFTRCAMKGWTLE